MVDRLRVAVVGMGIGQAHVYGYTRRKDLYEIAALCDLDEARTAPLAERLRGVRVTTELAEVCAADDIDVVSICTPPFLHSQQVTAVVNAGKIAVCEKPLVGSLAAVDRLTHRDTDTDTKTDAGSPDSPGARIMPIFQYRYGRGLQKLRALIDAGLAGDLYTINIEVAWRRRADYYAVPWRGKWGTELGGLLLSHCVHALDMATYIGGEPTRAFARTATRVNDIETEDTASASIELAGGAFVTLSATLGSASEISRHRFCFAGLSAESNTEPYANSSDPWTFVGDSPEQQQSIDQVLANFDKAPPAEDYQRQFELLHESVTAGAALPVTLADARRSIELVTALYASSREGAEVCLPIPRSHAYYEGWQP